MDYVCDTCGLDKYKKRLLPVYFPSRMDWFSLPSVLMAKPLVGRQYSCARSIVKDLVDALL